MAFKTRKNDTTKIDAYQRVTDNIIAALEKGTAPWERPWVAGSSMPRNGHSGYAYNGLNVLICWASGYADPRWYTFKQVQEYGKSHVRKGEKGTHIVKWLFLDKTETDESTGEQKTRRVPMLRTYVVFNHEQIEWDPEHQPKPLVENKIDPEAVYVEAARLAKGYETRSGVKTRHGGDRACYIPSLDVIHMPEAGAFADAGAYWATRLHEIVHSTGHQTRCNRDLSGRFGDESYAAEELVAELGSAFLSAELGLEGKLQHASYIQTWARLLKEDKYAIFTAARLAREAVSYLKGTTDTEEDESELAEAA